MMKRIILFLLFVVYFSSVNAQFENGGLISAGVYEGYVECLSGFLVVNGGGADTIMVRNTAHLEVWSTSQFVPGQGGIWDIVLTNTSRLDYYGGETEELTLYKNAEAHLYGGRIDAITSFQNVFWYYDQPTNQHVNIYAKPGWSWIEDRQLHKVGIQGVWADGTPFNIQFLDRTSFGADPTWANINVIEVIPEPATLLLFGLGGLLIRRKK